MIPFRSQLDKAHVALAYLLLVLVASARTGRRLGLTLGEIRELIDMYEPGRDDRAQLARFREVLETHRKSLLQQRADIEAQLAEIQTFEKRVQKQLKRR